MNFGFKNCQLFIFRKRTYTYIIFQNEQKNQSWSGCWISNNPKKPTFFLDLLDSKKTNFFFWICWFVGFQLFFLIVGFVGFQENQLFFWICWISKLDSWIPTTRKNQLFFWICWIPRKPTFFFGFVGLLDSKLDCRVVGFVGFQENQLFFGFVGFQSWISWIPTTRKNQLFFWICWIPKKPTFFLDLLDCWIPTFFSGCWIRWIPTKPIFFGFVGLLDFQNQETNFFFGDLDFLCLKIKNDSLRDVHCDCKFAIQNCWAVRAVFSRNKSSRSDKPDCKATA